MDEPRSVLIYDLSDLLEEYPERRFGEPLRFVRAESPEGLMSLARQHDPAVVMLDPGPEATAAVLVARLARASPAAAIWAVTEIAAPATVVALLMAGARAVTRRKLLGQANYGPTMRALLTGGDGAWLDPANVALIIEAMAARPAARLPFEATPLEEKMQAFLHGLARGLTQEGAAEGADLTRSTAQRRLTELRDRWRTRSEIEIGIFGERAGAFDGLELPDW